MQYSLDRVLNVSPDSRPPRSFNTPNTRNHSSRCTSPQNSPRPQELKILKCSNLQEAHCKMILLVAELNRLESLNITVIKQSENERLRNKDKEADLETKIAILLNENEKLNDLIEDLESSHTTRRSPIKHPEDFEDWRSLYQTRDNDYKSLLYRYETLKATHDQLEKNRGEMAKAAIDEFKDNRILRAKLQDAIHSLKDLTNKSRFKPEQHKQISDLVASLQQSVPKVVEVHCDLKEKDFNDSYNYGGSDTASEASSHIISQLREREIETESLKAELVKLTSSNASLSEKNHENEDLRNRYARVQVEYELLKEETSRLRVENEALIKKLESFRAEENLVEELKKKNKTLEDENGVFKGLIQLKSREIEELKAKAKTLAQSSVESNGFAEDLKAKSLRNHSLSMENQEIRAKLIELADARVTILEQEEAMIELKEDNMSLTKLFDEVNYENAQLKNKICLLEQLRTEVELSKSRALIAETEQQTLLRNNEEKQKEIDSLKDLISKMEICFNRK